jgi:hypothetical protein
MKEAIVSAIFVLSFLCAANCQWYYRSCGVSDINNTTSDEFDCLWKKSNNIAKVGRTTCAVGTTFMIAGGITMIAADPCCSSGVLLLGYFAVLGGGAINILGAPIWIVGGRRKSTLKESVHFNDQALKTIRITPVLQRNPCINNYTFGIAATISF